MNKLNKLQDLKTTLTQKQRIILLVVAVVVVLGALTATVFRDNLFPKGRRFSPQRPVQQPFSGHGR